MSILLAVRNEENNIINCLNALEKLNYPINKLEILIGNDASEDSTEYLVKEKIKQLSHFHLFNIKKQIGNLEGKTNILAHLIDESQGEILLMIDADTIAPVNWISSMLGCVQENVGIVIGTTLPKSNSILESIEVIDWLFVFSLVNKASKFNIPITAMGNNLLITKKAYLSIGGYENMPFSLTEDFALFHKTVRKGWSFRHNFKSNNLSITSPPSSFRGILSQRKRWMTGAMQLPVLLRFSLLLSYSFQLIIFALFFYTPIVGLIFFGLKIIIQYTWISFYLIRFKYLKELIYLPLYELFNLVFPLILIVSYYSKREVKWKGRKYHY